MRKGNNMKKSIYLLLTAILIISTLTMTACGKNTNEISTPLVATIDTSVNIDSIQSELSELKDKYSNITRIYDKSLKESINTYCEEYLSFTGSATDNIAKIKDVVSDEYYQELMSQTGHKKSDDDYEQSTGLDKLYYDNNSSPSDSIEVIALCKQTVIYDDEVTTDNVTYIFDMLYKSGKWVINGISAT